MIKKYLQYMLFGFLGLVFSVNSAYSTCYTYTGCTREIDSAVKPALPGSPSGTGFSTTCYCLVFRPGYATVEECDCTFTYKFMGMKTPVEDLGNNGGHNHNLDTHPLHEPVGGKLQAIPDSAATWLDGEKHWWVEGHTLYNPLFVRHPLPEVAGSIESEIIVTAPLGWACSGGCWTPDSKRYLDSINVGIGELTRLEDSGEHHVVMRGGTTTHPEGTYGKSDNINRLKEIAKEYFDRTDRKLSINDISLPMGGLFDYKNNWATPHKEHRTGTDVDINRTDGGGVYTNCWADDKLEKAVEEVAKGKNRPRLKCEDAVLMGGLIIWEDVYKHIDFD
jgi:hypothetical protein